MKKKDNSKNSIVDDLEGVEKLGGVAREVIQQTFCCKASHLLNEPEPEPIDLTIHTFPNIKNHETEEIKG